MDRGLCIDYFAKLISNAVCRDSLGELTEVAIIYIASRAHPTGAREQFHE